MRAEEAEGVETDLRSIVPARPAPGLLLPLLGHLPRWGAHGSPKQLGGADLDKFLFAIWLCDCKM